jgi:hypothetical protein
VNPVIVDVPYSVSSVCRREGECVRGRLGRECERSEGEEKGGREEREVNITEGIGTISIIFESVTNSSCESTSLAN